MRITATVTAASRAAVARDLAGVKGGAEKATAAAVKRTAATVESRTVRGVAKELGVPVTRLRRSRALKRPVWMTIEGEKRNPSGATISVTARRIPLKYLDAKQVKRSRAGAGGVTVRGAGRRRRRVPGAFIAETLNRHVFMRRRRSRLPIDRQETEPVSMLAARSPEVREVMAEAPKILEQNLASQVERLLKRRSRAR